MISYLLQSSICLIALYAVYYAFFRKDTFFQRNRFYLNTALLASLVIPLLSFPSWQMGGEPMGVGYVLRPLGIASASETPITLETVTIVAEQTVAQTWGIGLIVGVYLVVSAILLGKLLLSFVHLFRFVRQHRTEYHQGYRLVHTEGKLPTFSFFSFLFWDNRVALSASEVQQIKAHELAHIRGKHSYDLLLIELLKIVFWFNPVVYAYHRALVDQHEFIADRAVLQHTDLKIYARFVVQSIFQNTPLRVVHNFNQSQLKTRIKMMQKNATSRSKSWKVALALPMLALLLFTFSCNDSEMTGTPENPVQFKNQLPFGSADIVAQADKNAEPKEGFPALFGNLLKEVNLPEQTEGTVFIRFIVGKEGTLRNAEVKKGISPAIDEAILGSFVKLANTDWSPAMLEGAPVNQELILPVKIARSTTQKVETEAATTEVDQPAAPVGGMAAFMQALAANLAYPQEAQDAKLEGRVFVQFVVNKEGALQNAKVVRGFDKACEDAALAALTSLEIQWTPAMKDGKKVNSQMILPVTFRLN